MFLTEDEVLMGVTTLIKISVWDQLPIFAVGWHCVADHNPNTSLWCHCCHFLC